MPSIRWCGLPLAATLVLGLVTNSLAQTLPANLTKEDLARDNNLFLTLARKALKWDEPADRRFVAKYKRNFEDQVDAEMGVAKSVAK